jgi:hypothetical protein
MEIIMTNLPKLGLFRWSCTGPTSRAMAISSGIFMNFLFSRQMVEYYLKTGHYLPDL